jgi:virginiamycin B lyase
MWFIDESVHQLVRISMAGGIKEFNISGQLPGAGLAMAVGSDGRFYIGDNTTSITRVTTSGTAVMIPSPSGDSTAAAGIGLGPDGNIWFVELNHIAKLTPAGVVTVFAYPAQPGSNQSGGVTAGSDGNVWFGESQQNAIGRIVPSTGKIKMFPIPEACGPAPLVLAKDNNIWFDCIAASPKVGRITPSGNIKLYAIGGSFSTNGIEQFCSRGPDGEPWCASGDSNTVFRINTSSHTVTTFTPPLSPGARPAAVAAGPDGNIWADTTGNGDDIDVLVTNPMTVTPVKLTFTNIGQTKTVTVTENTVSSWTATSSDTGVATVNVGNPNSTFKVKSIGAGKCKVTISDGVGRK